jgi:hypothetical protein
MRELFNMSNLAGPVCCNSLSYRSGPPARRGVHRTARRKRQLGLLEATRGHLKQYFQISLPEISGRVGAGLVTKLGPGVEYAAVGMRVAFVARHT